MVLKGGELARERKSNKDHISFQNNNNTYVILFPPREFCRRYVSFEFL
jgi:hypothetical protein